MPKYPYQKLKNAEMRRLIAERAMDVDIETATRREMIQALRDYDEEQQDASAKQEDNQPNMKGKVKLMIPSTEGDGKDSQFVACNGRSWFVPKDKEVIVPKEVKNVLSLAVERVTDVTDNGEMKERPARRIPFTVLEEGPD